MFKVTRGYVLAATLTSADQSTETPYPVFSSQTKDNGLMGYYKDYLYENAITWTTDGANAGTVNFRSGKFYCTNVCGVLLSNDVKASPSIAEALNNVAKSYVSYVGNPKLMNNVMAEIEICIPIEKDEQDKLSQVFTILDNLITLHQRKQNDLFFLILGKKTSLILANDWEQRKLGDIAIEVNRTDANSNAPIMMITANDGFIEQSERYAFNNAGESLKRYIVLQKGELAYNHGASKLRPYGSCFALINQEKARIPFVYHCFSVENHNSEFISIELNGNDVESQLRRIVSSGARMDGLLNISFQDYASISILLPEKAEQDKITRVFRNLDNLITLHQCKQAAFFDWKRWLYSQFAGDKNTIAWEQRKLNQVSTIQKGEQISKTKLDSVGKYYVLNGGMEPSGYSDVYNTESNTISISEGGNSCGYVALNFERFWSGGHNYTLQNLKIDTDFLFHYLKGIEAKIMALRVGSGLPNIQKTAIDGIDVMFPSEDEQKLIGGFLTNLSNLITLHQRKYEKFVNIKKALLEKMFPQGDEKVPRIRFKGFTDAWEQRKLNEMVSYTASALSAKDVTDVGCYDLYDANSVIGKTNKGIMDHEYITIIKDGAGVGRVRILPAKTACIGTMGAMTARSSNLAFVYMLLCATDLSKRFSGSTIPHIYFKDYGQELYCIPKLCEQDKIATFLSNLDNLITLHQRQVEKLKNVKSALLEKMFV